KEALHGANLDYRRSLQGDKVQDSPFQAKRSSRRRYGNLRAIFSLGKYRKVETGCILVAGENLNRTNPPGPFYRDELRKSLSHAVDIAVESVINSQTTILRQT